MSPATSNATGKFESVLTKRFPPEGTAVAILVARDGKPLLAKAWGMADREKKVAATPETRFRIGSVTKQFTAAAVLRLQDQGKLSIDDKLAKYLPKFPRGEAISLRQLLNHTSGLHSYTAHGDFLKRVVKPVTPDDLIAYFQNDPPDFAPGERFEYCNSGYHLLGEIVRRVSGKASLGTFLQDEFFVPLKMANTGTWNNAAPPADAAKGYSWEDKKIVPALDWDMTWAGGAGELYSTVGDLLLWTEALHAGKVVSPASLALMTTPVMPPGEEADEMRYGMGLYHADLDWLEAIGHNGGLNGYQSQAMWIPKEKAAIIVLTNALPPEGRLTTPGSIVLQAARSFFAPEIAAAQPKEDLKYDAAKYADYVGKYDLAGQTNTVTTEGGKLFLQLDGQPRFQAFPSATDTFFLKVVPAKEQFIRDAAGKVTGHLHTQNGATMFAPRLSEKEAALVIPDNVLDAIAGQYQYGPGVIMTFTRRGTALYAQLTGQPEFPVYPKSEKEFIWKVAPARVEFTAGKDGAIVSATHHQGGVSLTAPKLPAAGK